jgi:hypothetical protein
MGEGALGRGGGRGGGGGSGGGGGNGGDSGGGGGIARWQIIDCWSMRRVADEPSSIHES